MRVLIIYCIRALVVDPGQTKVADFNLGLFDENVAWFEVSMDDSLGVNVDDPINDLFEDKKNDFLIYLV